MIAAVPITAAAAGKIAETVPDQRAVVGPRRGRRPDDSEQEPQASRTCACGEDRRIVRRCPPARRSRTPGRYRAGSEPHATGHGAGRRARRSQRQRPVAPELPRRTRAHATGRPGRCPDHHFPRGRSVPHTSGSCPSPGRQRSARRTEAVPTGFSGRNSRRPPASPVRSGCGRFWDPYTR
jgi:hypothetical protein